ncbi:hypothetical protein LVY75_34475 (plasmid) [Sinorhizobium sp. B11]|jgi:hypothetical protein
MLATIGAVISDIGRLIGIGGVLFIGLLLYEEGIPGAHRIPFLPSIPILGDLTAGSGSHPCGPASEARDS